MPGGLDDKTYRRRCKILRNSPNGKTCWLCNTSINLTLHYTDRMSWTADHVAARSKGGKLLGELRPAHRACNSARGNRGTIIKQPPVTTKKW